MKKAGFGSALVIAVGIAVAVAITSGQAGTRRSNSKTALAFEPNRGQAHAPKRISSEEAIARALNDVSASKGGFVLHHPRHRALFAAGGFQFRPRNGSPSWRWQLASAPAGVNTGSVRPVLEESAIVYRRGALNERYLPGAESIEQQFVLPARPALHGRDLVIAGRVDSAGRLRRTPAGWLWQTKQGAVRLGDVTVIDARGRELPARMSVTRDHTRIVVEGAALARATYPVTVDPEVGANDFRISDMGPPDTTGDGFEPAVAYNSTNNEYLVVWRGDDGSTPPLADGELEIFGQRLSASTGAEVGPNDFRISDMGPDGNASFSASVPAVAYNATNNEYLVVWRGDDNAAPLVDNELEIFGQRLTASGSEILPNDFRISDMGPNGNTAFGAFEPAVTHNATNNEYLVVWHGDDNTAPLGDEETEIFGQRLSATTGAGVGANDFRISDMGVDGNASFDAVNPAVAHNAPNNEYLVVWTGDDGTAPLVDNEFEIFGQRLSAATGAAAGANDFRISDMGPNGNPSFVGFNPAVAYNPTNNEYLVVWHGDDNTAPLVDDEAEIFGQRLNAATGAAAGANDFRISDMGPNGNPNFGAREVAVAYNATNNEYLVVWRGDDDTAPLVFDEREIFGQRLNATTGAAVGANDFRISDMGPDGDVRFGVFLPAAAYNATNNEYLVVWTGDDDTAPLVDNEEEIFGERLTFVKGNLVGANDFRISDMGPADTTADGFEPAVAYNATNNEYLVVWSGDDGTAPLVDEELEIFGQRLNAATGAAVGVNDFRISDMGPDGNASFDALDPAVAYNAMNNEYLVVWSGDDNTAPLVDNELEIFGQRLTAGGSEIAPNDFRISDMGPNGNTAFGAFLTEDEGNPAVAYNARNNEYLVVWMGDDDTAPLVDNEFEIFGQRLNAGTGAAMGANDFRISDMGPNGNTTFRAANPAVAYNATDDEYLVVWSGDDNTASLVDNEFEVFGQRLNAATGAAVGVNDFRISDMGPDGNANFDAFQVAVAYNAANNEYLVVWGGDDNPVDNEFEIFGQRLRASGAQIAPNDFRISDMGPDGNTSFHALEPAVAYAAATNEYLVVWRGDDNTAPLVSFEFEIFGQQLNAATGAAVGANDFRLSDMGPGGNTSFAASNPAVAYRAASNSEYLIVWQGDDDTASLVDNELEIFGQRLAEQLVVGTFTLVPSDATVTPGQRVNFELTWVHPGRWRDLNTIDLRIVGGEEEGNGENGEKATLLWVRWDEAANTFSILKVRAGKVAAFLDEATAIGSGPEGLSVTLNLPVAFKREAAGEVYRIEVAATDDFGNGQGFERAGTVRVERADGDDAAAGLSQSVASGGSTTSAE